MTAEIGLKRFRVVVDEKVEIDGVVIDNRGGKPVFVTDLDGPWMLAEDVILKMENTGTCTWTEDDEGTWWTECDEGFCLTDGTPSENSMNFCSYCGKKLVEKRYEPEAETDDDE